MMNWIMMAEWRAAGAPLFNETYEEEGPCKSEIEAMKTDAEYEAAVVDIVRTAWDGWSLKGRPGFEDLSPEDQVAAVRAALDDERAEFGWYRGALPSEEAVRRALGLAQI